MPIYEFLCERCGRRFEELAEAGTGTLPCPECGAARTRRVYSAPRAPFKVVMTPGQAGKQERENAQLREGAKRRFAEARRRSRQTRGGTR